MAPKTVEWAGDALNLIDQRKLPRELSVVACCSCSDVATAIRNMTVRGAPAIGVAAAFGLALGALASRAKDKCELLKVLNEAADELRSTRPTARDLFWGIQRVEHAVESSASEDVGTLKQIALAEAQAIALEDEARCRAIAAHGARLISDGASILTHCNAGALATSDYGTALGVIREAYHQGKRIHVFVDETRPLLQGSRLTAWELTQAGIPMTLITDNMAGHFMRQGKIDLAIVGADRIAANGDVANKIGTYMLAGRAKEQGIPLYVAAPISTVDFSLPSGESIPIEERAPEEVTTYGGVCTAPDGVHVANPAFDVTPHRYVAAIITERGIVRKPYDKTLARLAPTGERRDNATV